MPVQHCGPSFRLKLRYRMPRIDLSMILADMGLGQNQGTFLLVPRIRIMVFLALYIGGCPISGNHHIGN